MMNNFHPIGTGPRRFSNITGPSGTRGHFGKMLAAAMVLLLMYPLALRAQNFGMASSAPVTGFNSIPMAERPPLASPSYAIGDTPQNDSPDATDSDDPSANSDDDSDSNQNDDSADDDDQNQSDNNQDNAQSDSDDNSVSPPPGMTN